jgi:hypothetical protein
VTPLWRKLGRSNGVVHWDCPESDSEDRASRAPLPYDQTEHARQNSQSAMAPYGDSFQKNLFLKARWRRWDRFRISRNSGSLRSGSSKGSVTR